MSEAYQKFIELEQEAKRAELVNGVFSIDTHTRKPGIRHLARYTGTQDAMQTLCGRYVVNYTTTSGGLLSTDYADGTPYVTLCQKCYGREVGR